MWAIFYLQHAGNVKLYNLDVLIHLFMSFIAKTTQATIFRKLFIIQPTSICTGSVYIYAICHTSVKSHKARCCLLFPLKSEGRRIIYLPAPQLTLKVDSNIERAQHQS